MLINDIFVYLQNSWHQFKIKMSSTATVQPDMCVTACKALINKYGVVN